MKLPSPGGRLLWRNISPKMVSLYPRSKLKPYRDSSDEDDDTTAGEDETLLFSYSPAYLPHKYQRRGEPWIFRITVVLTILIALGFIGLFTAGEVMRGKEVPAQVGVVLASYKGLDTSWTNKVPPVFKFYNYVLDDVFAIRRVPRNQGREAMVYLTYIIDNYYKLPNYTVFMHGHDRGWHQLEHSAWKLRALNLTELDRVGYINFRCVQLPGCTPETSINVAKTVEGEKRPQAILLPFFWKAMLSHIPPPERLEVPCCGQFAVTRQAIQAYPLDWWKRYRAPMLKSFKEVRKDWNAPQFIDSYRIGMLYEKTWHVVFGRTPVFCPAENYCREVAFSNMLGCEQYIGFYEESKGWEEISCWSPWGKDNFTKTEKSAKLRGVGT